MLRVSRILYSSSVFVKKTTGLVGLDVVPDARNVLIKLYEKTLRDVKIIPETAEYRKEVEKFTNYRLNVVQTKENIDDIETTIGCGQVEELIEQAKSELQLIPQYATWKFWEHKRPLPQDDNLVDIYDELDYLDSESIQKLGLSGLAQQKRAEIDAQRKAAIAAAQQAANPPPSPNPSTTASPTGAAAPPKK